MQEMPSNANHLCSRVIPPVQLCSSQSMLSHAYGERLLGDKICDAGQSWQILGSKKTRMFALSRDRKRDGREKFELFVTFPLV